VSRYFAQRLLLWMPRKLWQIELHCLHPECEENPLTGAGVYPRVRQVLDIDGYYILAAEYLECSNTWSPSIIKQLDIGHQLQFHHSHVHSQVCE
jgi:hypothetical protein